MPITTIFGSPSPRSIEMSGETPAQQDERLVKEQQKKLLGLIEEGEAAPIEAFLRNSTRMFELSSGPCTLLELLEKCDPPLMHTALETGKIAILHTLISLLPPSAFNATDAQGRTLLIRAAELGLADEVKYLLAAGAAISAADHDGNTSLIRAAAKGFANIVAILLGFEGTDDQAEIRRERNEFLNLNASNHQGKNALMVACEAGHVDVVRTILAVAVNYDIPLDLNAPDNDLDTTWHYAIESGNKQIVQAFIDAGYSLGTAEVDTITELSGHKNVAPGSPATGLLTKLLDTPRASSKAQRLEAMEAWTKFSAASTVSVSAKSSASPTSATSSISTSSAPTGSALAATQPAPRAASHMEEQIATLLKRFSIEFEAVDGAVNVTSSGHTVLKNADFFTKAERLIGDHWFSDSLVDERQLWAYMAVGEVIVNTLHDSEYVTGSALTVPGANGERVPLENSIAITHAIAWYCLALAGQYDQPPQDDSRRVAKDTAAQYFIPDPKGHLFNYLETLESASEHDAAGSERASVYTIEDNGATETLIVGTNPYFPGDGEYGMIYRRIAGEGDNGQLMFRFPVLENFAQLVESTRADSQATHEGG